MTLNDLEMAIRPQFIWDGPPENWKVNRHREVGGEDLAVTVFIGMATMHKFSREFICAKLKIPGQRYDVMWFRFHKNIREAIHDERSSLDHNEIAAKVLAKARMVQSFLQLNHKAPAVNFFEIGL